MAKGETGWNELRFDLSPYEGEKGYIAIHHLDYDQVCLSIDEFRIFTGEMQYVHTDLTELKLEGLQPNTEYGYMIFAHKMSDKSANTELATFTTLPTNPAPSDFAVEPGITTADISWTGYSDSYKVRYRTAEVIEEKPIFFEDFENGLEDKGWLVTTDLEHIEGKEGWFTTDATAENPLATNHSGSNVVSSWTYNLLDYAQNQLISPLVEFKGKLKFWQWTLDGCPDSYAVYLGWGKTAEEYAIHGFPLGLRSLQPGLPGWNEMVFDLTPFEGHQGYICIEHSDFNMYALFIDDFGIYEDVVVAPQGEWQEIETTDPFVTIEGLDRETKYEFEVIGIKAGEEDAVSELTSFTTISPSDIAFDAQDENTGSIAFCNGQYANVTIENYTIKKDGKWHSICLPFDVKLEGSILEGATLRQPSDAKEVDTYLIIDCLTECDKIEAGKPYLIKFDAGEDIVNPVFKDVKISDSTEPTKLYGDKIYVIPEYNKFFVGPTDDFYYTTDGNLRLARINLQKECAMEGFTTSFYISSSLNSGLDGIGLNFGDMNLLDIITGINIVKSQESSDDAIYNVAGQRLSKTQKGINIVNGNKVLVK
jgi:hypothetical protein